MPPPAGDDGLAAVSEDALLGGRVRLLQPRSGYRAAIDPVLLAAAVAPTAGSEVLDLGCGVGAAALCLMWRCPNLHVTGLELQEDLVALARKNAQLNGCEAQFLPRQGDLREAQASLGRDAFDQVMVNPPYQAAAAGRPSQRRDRALANHEGGLGLPAWLDVALGQLRPQGILTVIHRADRLPDLLAGLEGRAGRMRVLPLWPATGRPAKRVLVAAHKGGRGPAVLLPGLVLHEPDGRYTAAAQAILRDGAPIAW